MSQLLKSPRSIYNLETQKERQVRVILSTAIFIGVVAVGYFFLPQINEAIQNWIEFGVSMGKVAIALVVAYALWMMRDVLKGAYFGILKKISRAIVRTDLPTFLEVVVANRRNKLARFTTDVGKMRTAINAHTESMAVRKKSMTENLQMAEYFKKQSENKSLHENERMKATDNMRHHANEAVADKNAFELMQGDKDKMLKTYYFFERLRNSVKNDTESLSNKVERMRSQLHTSAIWKDAAQGATALLGVSEFEDLTLEETRKRITENEASVMNMIADQQYILEKMEAKNDIMDAEGQKLLEQYSANVSPDELLQDSQLTQEDMSGSVMSMTEKYKDLFPNKGSL